jgi:hypothetical protein
MSTFSPTPTHFKGKNPKRGLAFADGDTPADLINANQSQSVISWQYNWASLPPAYLATSNIKYIPMQWGSGGADQFQESVQAQGADTILGFNEPDFANESNMDPAQAAALWMEFIQPLKAQGIRLGGPAVTASGTGQPWLKTFFAACTNCTIDFLPLHWYGSGTEGFYNYLWEMHGLYPNIPIWVTEYAETSTNDTVVLDFLNQTITYLDSLDWIERYSWFGFFRPKPDLHYNLLDADGGLNALGKLYVGADTIHTQLTTGAAGFKTIIGGSDSPSQGLVTTWPALNGAVSGWNMGANQMLCILIAFSSGIPRGLWTIW